MWWLIGIILGKIICESSNWQHIHRLKIALLGANWQLFRLERVAKCSYFILSTQNIKFYWFVLKIKKFLLPIWWYNRGLFPLGNKYFGVFVLNGLRHPNGECTVAAREVCKLVCNFFTTKLGWPWTSKETSIYFKILSYLPLSFPRIVSYKRQYISTL